MKKATTRSIVTATAALLFTGFAGSAALAAQSSDANFIEKTASPMVSESRKKAQLMVKRLMKQNYDREGYEARAVRRKGSPVWEVTITKRAKPVAIAFVNPDTGSLLLEQ